MKRWVLLENNPALLNAGWLPPEEVCPELRQLRAEHTRLLAIVREETAAYNAVRQRHEAEDAERAEQLRQAFLGNGDPGSDERATEEGRSTELEDARLRAVAATDALVEFLNNALAQIQAFAPQLYLGLESRRDAADAKLIEAHRLVAEAEQEALEVERLRNWIDRESGVSQLGHYPYNDMPAAIREPATV